MTHRQELLPFAGEVPDDARERLARLGLDPEAQEAALRFFPTLALSRAAERDEEERRQAERAQLYRNRCVMADELLAGKYGKDARLAAENALKPGRTMAALAFCANLVWEANKRKAADRAARRKGRK